LPGPCAFSPGELIAVNLIPRDAKLLSQNFDYFMFSLLLKPEREVGSHRGQNSWVGQACVESRVCKIVFELGTCIEILLLLRDLLG
jgi:hypothetical protein